MGKVFMGYWDCPYCGQNDVPGSDHACPNCGRTRDNTVVYHPTPHGRPNAPKKYVTDPDEAERLRHSPDWHCSFCDSMNPHSQYRCPNCGHTRNESDRNYFHRHPERKDYVIPVNHPDSTGNSYSSNSYRHVDKGDEETEGDSHRQSHHFQLPDLPWKRIGIIMLIVAIVAGIAAGAWFIFSPKERYITVTDMYWARSIDIEEYRTVRESDWSVPSGGRIQYTQQEIHHYDTVLDHYDTVTKSRQVITGSHEIVTGYSDLGNGYFEEITSTVYDFGTEYYTEQEPVYRQDPVYRTKYYYDIERWKYDYTVKSGAHDKEPYWPEYTLEDDKHRAGLKSQSYKITAVYEDKSDNYSMNYNDWIETSIDDQLHVKVHFGGRIELLKDEKE